MTLTSCAHKRGQCRSKYIRFCPGPAARLSLSLHINDLPSAPTSQSELVLLHTMVANSLEKYDVLFLASGSLLSHLLSVLFTSTMRSLRGPGCAAGGVEHFGPKWTVVQDVSSGRDQSSQSASGKLYPVEKDTVSLRFGTLVDSVLRPGRYISIVVRNTTKDTLINLLFVSQSAPAPRFLPFEKNSQKVRKTAARL